MRFHTAAVVALATAATASAQVTSSVPLGDEYFAMRAYAEGLAEISMSQLAISATQQNIREFAVGWSGTTRTEQRHRRAGRARKASRRRRPSMP